MLAADCIIIHVDDARKLVDAFGGMHSLRLEPWKFTKADMERMNKAGVFLLLSNLRKNVRDHDSLEDRLD